MVEVMLDVDAMPLPALTLRTETWELHIRAPLTDLARLSGIRTANWDDRRSLRIGECAGAPVFWSLADNDQAAILIGQDDETWAAAFLIPLKTVTEIAAQAASATRG